MNDILSKAKIKQIKQLKNKSAARKLNKFLCEGVKTCECLINSPYKNSIDYFVISDKLKGTPVGLALYNKIKSEFKVRKLTGEKFKTVSTLKNPEGVLCVLNIIKKPHKPLSGYKKIIYLYRVSDPQNAGLIIRSAAAFNFDMVALSPGSVYMYNHKLIKSSSGYFFHIDIKDKVKLEEITSLSDHKIYALDLNGKPLKKAVLNDKIIIIAGNESSGFKQEKELFANIEKIRIPNSVKVDSLNVHIAASIMMYEIFDAAQKKK